MIVVDSSAIVSVAFGEPDAPRFANALGVATRRLIGAPTLLEVSLAVGYRLRDAGRLDLRRLLPTLALEPVPFGSDHLEAAEAAWWTYGKGRHRAALNYGDCMAYAVAKVADAPLLYKGTDFGLTDIRSALV